MGVAEKDKEYFEELDRQRKATDSFYREQIALMEKSSASIERVSRAAADWGRDDLAPWDEAKSYGKEAAAYAAASHEANEGSSFVTGEVIVGDFRRNGQSVGSQETLIAKSVRLSDRDWQNFSTGSDAVRSDIAKQHLGDVYVDGAQHGVAFNPSLSSANQNPYVVIPNKDGQIDSITQSAQKSNVTPEQKAAMASTLSQMEARYAGKDFRNGVYVDHPQPGVEAQSGKPNGGDSPSQKPTAPALSYQSGSLNFGHAGGSAWGGNKVAESWTIHEQKQSVLKQRIDSAERRLEEVRLSGGNVSEHETTLKIAQNSYAMAEHEQAARSWSNTASYARVSQVGGMADMYSANQASFMADYHRLQAERIREQQLELKNPEIAAQRAQEAAALQAQVEEQRRYLLEIQENNRKIQAEMGGPTTQDKINSLDQMLAGKQPEPAKAEAPQQIAEQKPAQAQAVEPVQPEPQIKQAEAPAQQQAQVQQAEKVAQAEAPQRAAEQQSEPVKAAEQAQPEPQAQQVEAPVQQQAEVKAVDATADAGTTADQASDEQTQQQAQVEQKQPDPQAQQAEQAPQAEAPQPAAEQQQEPVKAAEQAQPEPQAQQVEAPVQQQAEVKVADANADAGTTADQAADEQTQQQAQVEQKQPEAQVQQAEQGKVAEQQANQAEHKAAVENAQGVSTARAQETGQAPQQVSAAPANSGDQVKGNEVQQVSQDQASQQASQPAAQDKGYDPHQRVRDMEAQGQAQIDKEKEQGTYQSNDQASMNSLNEQSSQAQQAQAEIAQGQQQEQGKSMSM